jgi:hypothetical protein
LLDEGILTPDRDRLDWHTTSLRKHLHLCQVGLTIELEELLKQLVAFTLEIGQTSDKSDSGFGDKSESDCEVICRALVCQNRYEQVCGLYLLKKLFAQG